MNLRNWINYLAGVGNRATAALIFRQSHPHSLCFTRTMTLSFICAGCSAISLLLAATSISSAQTNYYSTNGGEYTIVGALPGNQVFPDAAISTTGGFVVWQDNATDGDGWGVSARRLDATFSGTLGTFRVNQIGAGDQENARVAMLKNGGAVFVWQGGKEGYQHIYTRFFTATNTFTTTNDILVNTFTNNFQVNPAVAVLTNGNVVVLWGSYNEAATNSLQDIYGQILSPVGAKVGTEFLVNQFTNYNQRTPTVAALPNGGFVAGWVSEQQRVVVGSLGTNTIYAGQTSAPVPSVDIFARLFNASGTATSSEFLVNPAYSPSANPAVAVAQDGSFIFVWGGLNQVTQQNSWDIYARPFTNTIGGGTSVVNTHVTGDQYNPRISAIAYDYLISWTSLGQDGSREGIFAQFLHNNGATVGKEFRVNTMTANQQFEGVVAADGVSSFLVVWSTLAPVTPLNFDLAAQRYANVAAVLQPMSAPYVWAPFVVTSNVFQPRLVVTWPPLLGLSVSNFEVYVDGAVTNIAAVKTNQWTMTALNGLTANSTHTFQVDYVVTDGRRSPLSASGSGTVWSGLSWYGIPFEWMEQFYGMNAGTWPTDVNAPLTKGGLSLLQVFVSGGSPLDSTTWLRQSVTRTAQGLFLNWNTQAGATYQVQATTNFNSWSNVGSPRFAAGTSDSIYIGGSSAGYYRVVLLRQ